MSVEPKHIIDLFGLKNAYIRRSEIICSCPFIENHSRGDLRPSFGINFEKGVAHCLGCGWSGNLIKMAEELLHLDYKQAFSAIYPDLTVDDALAMMSGIRYEGIKAVSPIEFNVDMWAQNKHDYWYGRGFTDKTIGKWRLGYDKAENRVTVPIYFDKMLVGYTKRAVDNVTLPKWKHSENLPRNQILFGVDNFSGDSCILVEAPLSAIMLDQYGYNNAVASFGCSLSDEQALLLRSRYNKVLLYYDPDAAGIRGTKNAIAKLSDFLDVYVMPRTSDDPAATPIEEINEAMGEVVPAWFWKMTNFC